MKVSFDGIAEMAATFSCANVKAGQPVKITASGLVEPAGNGEMLAGVALTVGAEFACVQLKGTVTLPYTGVMPPFGHTNFVSNGQGGVKVGGSVDYIVLAVQNGKVTFLM